MSPNLYIVDGSAFTTGGVVNPTSTVCALALRAAEHLRDDFNELRRATGDPSPRKMLMEVSGCQLVTDPAVMPARK